MRVLQLFNRQYSRGGAEIVMEREADGLETRGHVVERLVVDNRKVAELGSFRAGGRAVWNRAASRSLRMTAAWFEPDVVHAHAIFPIMSPAVLRQASALGLPVVSTPHSWRQSCLNGQFLRDGQQCRLCLGHTIKLAGVRHRCYHESVPASAALATSLAVHRVLKTFSECVDCHLALTPSMKDALIAEGVDPARVVVKPNAVPDYAPVVEERDGYVLFVGRLTVEKGVRTLLNAWRRLEIDVPLVVAGDGPLRELVESSARSDQRISSRGWVDETEVRRLLAHAELVVVPSEWDEAFGLVVPESYSCGTPVIASSVGALPDLVEPRVTGALVPPGDSPALAEAVGSMLRNPGLASLRAGARRAFERRFRDEHTLDTLEQVYEGVIVARESGRGAAIGAT